MKDRDYRSTKNWDTSAMEKLYSDNEQEYPHMMAVAMVTDSCIPKQCKKSGSITDAEEYIITLKQRLIKKCSTRKDLNLKMVKAITNPPDATEGENSDGYIVCVAFNLIKGKYWRFRWT